MIIELLKAILYGIVEGITEWLPVSSTGHLILLEELVAFDIAPNLGPEFATEFFRMFEVVIQLGAILAVAVTFFNKLCPFSRSKTKQQKTSTWKLWGKVMVASIPAAAAGVGLDKIIENVTGKSIDGWIYNWQVVAAALIIYGILFIIIERANKNKPCSVCSVEDITLGQSALIGVFQALSIVPGTSRSGSTILGARLIGISRGAAAQFSFFLGIPAMLGASLIRSSSFFSYVAESNVTVPLAAWVCLAVASAVAFGVSMLTIKFLIDFVARHSFAPFGVYRIILGVLVIIFFLMR